MGGIAVIKGSSVMKFDVDEATRKKAKTPHELFMINIAVFHLLLGPASVLAINHLFGNSYAFFGLLIPVLISCLFILYTYFRKRSSERNDPWFVAVNWNIALRRYGWMFIAYAITTIILTGGWLLGLSAEQRTMQEIIFTISSRIGIMPMIIMTFVSLVLESSSLGLVVKGEIADSLVKHFPPPDGVVST